MYSMKRVRYYKYLVLPTKLYCRKALWGDELRGVQGFLQALHEEGPGLQVPRQQGLQRQ